MYARGEWCTAECNHAPLTTLVYYSVNTQCRLYNKIYYYICIQIVHNIKLIYLLANEQLWCFWYISSRVQSALHTASCIMLNISMYCREGFSGMHEGGGGRLNILVNINYCFWAGYKIFCFWPNCRKVFIDILCTYQTKTFSWFIYIYLLCRGKISSNGF